MLPKVELLWTLGHEMNIKDILSVTYSAFSKLSVGNLVKAFQSLREKYVKLEKENNELKAENQDL